MYEDSLPIVELKELVFCPRIPWYTVNNFSKIKPSLWMQQGEEYHIDREKLMKKRLLRRFKDKDYKLSYRVNVYSVLHGIHGIVDAIIDIEQEKIEILQTIEKVKLIRSNGLFPDSSASQAKCAQCEYLLYCNDREI